MKKFFLFVTAISISLAVMSQKGKVTSALSYIDQGRLDKAKEDIDQALTNEKTRNWFNTFYAKGRLCQAVFESDNPEFKAYYPDPLAEAYTSYEKALELDTKGTLKKKMITTMVYNTMAVDLFSQGSSRFEADDFEGALKSFETQIKITEGDKYAGAVDTGMYFNAGLAAVNAKKYREAINYFEKCTEMQYLGITPFINISDSYLGLGDTARAESVLQSLSVKFPDNKDLILQLIDIYIKSNNNDEALRYINIAKESDPTNYRLYLASGIIYLNQNRYDEAIMTLPDPLK